MFDFAKINAIFAERFPSSISLISVPIVGIASPILNNSGVVYSIL